MSFIRQPRFWLMAGVALVGALILQQIWHWEVERIDVPAGKFVVRVHRWGKNLPEGSIVAPDTSYKGVMLEVLPEGRHFLNPLFWSHELHNLEKVAAGKCLVVTRQFGTKLPPERVAAGDILARENRDNPIDGEQGIVRDVLPPGAYRLNPYAYKWEEVDAVEVRVDQVGVRTLKVGPQHPPEKDQGPHQDYTVPDGFRGVQRTPVPPGTYYVNPYVETITPVEVRSHRVELPDIKFPSRDGFILSPQVVVEYAVMPSLAPELLVRLTDAGILHQRDATEEDKTENEVLQKVILPHIRGYSRIEGSNFDARDFILTAPDAGNQQMANARETFQRALLAKVKPRCAELGVDIRAVTLADFRPPEELADQISQRELARVEQEKNKVRIGQFKAEQELMAKQALKQQAKEKVESETRRIQAKAKADQMKQVEESRLKQDLANAALSLEAAHKQAEATLSTGKAEAAVIHLQNEAEVAGLEKAVRGFDSVGRFAQYHVVKKLAPALREIFASDDSDFARIFSAYMTQSPSKPNPFAPAKDGRTAATESGDPTGSRTSGR